MLQRLKKIPAQILIGFIWFYRNAISPWLGSRCRYEPSCSEYCQDCIKAHGFWAGLYLSVRRIFSCHPYSKRERFDPVPKGFAWRDLLRYNRGTDE